jgi:hypothetical protein
VISPERLADLLDRHEKGADDTLELLLGCLGNGINVLDHRNKGRDNWIADIKRYQADHAGLLTQVQRLTDELDHRESSSDQAASREIDLHAEVDQLRGPDRALRNAVNAMWDAASSALTAAKAECDRFHTIIARIEALEVYGREFVDAAELYRILDKPIPPPIDHAANLRAKED